MELIISFQVSGSIEQIIILKKDCKYTAQDIVLALKGKHKKVTCRTTIWDSKEFTTTSRRGKRETIGYIEDSDDDLEYLNFELLEAIP